MFYNKFRISVLVFLVFLLISIFGVRGVFAAEPSLLFSPEKVSARVGEKFDVVINVDTAGQKVGGVGAKVVFSNTNLKVVSIRTGTIFDSFPTAAFDNNQGKIIISGIKLSMTSLFSGTGVLATVTFQTIAPGQSNIQFLFTPGSTNDSNIAVTYGNGDILAKVNRVAVVVTGVGVSRVNGQESTSVAGEDSTLKYILRAFEKIGVTPKSFQIFATRIIGKEVDTQQDLSQSQPLGSKAYFSSKTPMEQVLTILLVVSLILIPLVWLTYILVKRRNKV